MTAAKEGSRDAWQDREKAKSHLTSVAGITDPASLPRVIIIDSVGCGVYEKTSEWLSGRQWKQLFDLRTFILSIPGFQNRLN